jgi:hypothetical protein
MEFVDCARNREELSAGMTRVHGTRAEWADSRDDSAGMTFFIELEQSRAISRMKHVRGTREWR